MSQDARSPRQIEADIEATRNRLAATVDELAYRTKPGVIVQREKEAVLVKLQQTFTTPNGDLRMERVAAVAVVVAALVGISIFRRTHR